MSIYISDMEMPKERESFTITVKYNGMVFDTETGIQIAEAYELPLHGRLGDLDVICKECEKGSYGYDGIFPDCIHCPIHLIPTIIPAEED